MRLAPGRLVLLAVALLAGLLISACSGSPPSGPPPATAGTAVPQASSSRPSAGGDTPSAADPCLGTPAPHYRHVVWVWMENKSSDAVIGSPQAPFENRLARECGLAADYHGIAHPSLPNYLAATGGSTFGVTDDAPASDHPVPGESLFGQVDGAGQTWRAYEESMPSPCRLTPVGRYAVRHNPAAYFTELRSACRVDDVGFDAAGRDIASGSLPSFAFVTPDVCSDTHDCPVSTGDAWLQVFLTRLLDGANYRAGDTVLILTWDEAEGGGTTVPTIVVAPSVRPGTVVNRNLDHYSLLRTTEDLLGLAPLRNAASASSMAPAFGL
jgi:hypothetical protein